MPYVDRQRVGTILRDPEHRRSVFFQPGADEAVFLCYYEQLEAQHGPELAAAIAWSDYYMVAEEEPHHAAA